MAEIFIAYAFMGFLFGVVCGLGITIGKAVWSICSEFITNKKKNEKRKQEMREVCLEVLTEMIIPEDKNSNDNK